MCTIEKYVNDFKNRHSNKNLSLDEMKNKFVNTYFKKPYWDYIILDQNRIQNETSILKTNDKIFFTDIQFLEMSCGSDFEKSLKKTTKLLINIPERVFVTNLFKEILADELSGINIGSDSLIDKNQTKVFQDLLKSIANNSYEGYLQYMEPRVRAAMEEERTVGRYSNKPKNEIFLESVSFWERYFSESDINLKKLKSEKLENVLKTQLPLFYRKNFLEYYKPANASINRLFELYYFPSFAACCFLTDFAYSLAKLYHGNAKEMPFDTINSNLKDLTYAKFGVFCKELYSNDGHLQFYRRIVTETLETIWSENQAAFLNCF